MRHHIDGRTAGALASVIALSMGTWVSSAFAGFVAGGGNAAADCYAGFEVTGVTSSASPIDCTDGDPCDLGACGDGKCSFQLRICVNQPGVPGCTPPARGLRIVKAPRLLQSSIRVELAGSACGRPLTFDLKLKKNGRRSNRRVFRTSTTAVRGTKPRKDQDSFTFVCRPRTQACPASTSAAFLP